MKNIAATGKRKTAVAKVRLVPNGKGVITVNEMPLAEYFPADIVRNDITMPLTVTQTLGSFDIIVETLGGGKNGQAGAIRLGISRALVEYNEELKSALRGAGLLTRDPRMVERKKYGRKKARKRFQFSKR